MTKPPKTNTETSHRDCTVSVVITTHNYAKFLPQAIGSVLNQSYDDYEFVVVNDGSTDDTGTVLSRFEAVEKLHIITLEGVGLAKSANIGIRSSRGKYVIRLDADDYFDENILMILSNILDRHPEYGMVYPDYYQVNKYGEIISQVRQQKINDEVKLLDRSPLAAGAMYRRECYDAIGGYNEELSYQEDYDFWIRFIEKFNVYNVQLPLMYYRKHVGSMSTNTVPRVKARQYVKQKFVKQTRSRHDKKIMCVLPMVAENRYKPRLPVVQLNGQPMLAYVLKQAQQVDIFDRIIVDTEDEEIAEQAARLGAEVPFLRPKKLAKLDVPPVDVLKHLIKTLHGEQRYLPDIILMAYYNNPFIRAASMEEVVNTLMIYKCDSVISVVEDLKFHWQRGENGLKPVLYPRKILTDEKWQTYEEKGGIYALSLSNLKTDSFLGKSISFIEISEVEALRVKSDFTFWMAEQIARQYHTLP